MTRYSSDLVSIPSKETLMRDFREIVLIALDNEMKKTNDILVVVKAMITRLNSWAGELAYIDSVVELPHGLFWDPLGCTFKKEELDWIMKGEGDVCIVKKEGGECIIKEEKED